MCYAIIDFSRKLSAAFGVLAVLFRLSHVQQTRHRFSLARLGKFHRGHLRISLCRRTRSTRFAEGSSIDLESTTKDERALGGCFNHKFDHSYVKSAIKKFADKTKGMIPSLPADRAVSMLEDLALKSFVGVRFNIYILTKESDGK